MSNSINKILSISLYALLGLSTLFGVLFYAGALGTETLMYWCYILMGISIVIAVVFSIANMIKIPKSAKSAIIGIAALVVVLLISYALASDEVTEAYADFISGPEASRRVGMGLIAMYILGIGAIASILFSGISKLFK